VNAGGLAADEDLTAQKELLDITLRSIRDGVIATNAQGAVRLMNPTAERLCGWTQSEAWGKPIEEVFPVIDELSRLPLKLSPAQKADHAVLVCRTGEFYNLDASTSLIRNAAGQGQGEVLVFRDITGQAKIQELLQKTDKIHALGVLAGGLAHDFNNLLGGIFGYLSLAKASLPDPSKTRDYLDKAGAVFHRAKALTTQLTTFSEEAPPLRRPGRLAPLIRSTGTFVLSGSNILADYSLSEDLGLCDFDAAQMSQVFTNLIINSKQAMPKGGTIRISAHNTVLAEGEVPRLHRGEYLKISVADCGEGIPLHLFGKLFDPFFTTRKANQGLGLSTCRSIILKHGGAIEVQSKPGQGTVVQVFLPTSLENTTDSVFAPCSFPAAAGDLLLMDEDPLMALHLQAL